MQIFKFHVFLRNLLLALIVFPSIISTSFGNPFHNNKKNHYVDTLEKVSMMFKVNHGRLNSFEINNHPAFKKQKEKFRFNTTSELPEGLLLSGEGMLTWSPTPTQFNNLKAQAFLLNFYAQ